jgi:tRNA-dihydrouridine synthase
MIFPLRTLIEHTKLFEEKLGDIKNFAVMKKHFATYVVGFEGAKELRMKLMETNNTKEVEEVITTFLKKEKEI